MKKQNDSRLQKQTSLGMFGVKMRMIEKGANGKRIKPASIQKQTKNKLKVNAVRIHSLPKNTCYGYFFENHVKDNKLQEMLQVVGKYFSLNHMKCTNIHGTHYLSQFSTGCTQIVEKRTT